LLESLIAPKFDLVHQAVVRVIHHHVHLFLAVRELGYLT
jgi:hypothetical protein